MTEPHGLALLARLLTRSPLALVATALTIGLAIYEIASKSIQEEITKQIPFSTSLVGGVLLLVIGASLVEEYLREIERRQSAAEREAAEDEWKPSAERVAQHLADAVRGSRGIVFNAAFALKSDPSVDVDVVAEPVDRKAAVVKRELDQWLPVLLLRKDLVQVARRSEEVYLALDTVAWSIRRESGASREVFLDISEDTLKDAEAWFDEQQRRAREALMARLSTP